MRATLTTSEGQRQAADDLEYAGEKLINDTCGWLVARPQRTDGNAWLKTLVQFLDARDRVKSEKAE